CNTGAAAARGRMIVLLNSDTEPEPIWLEELVKAFVANPQAAAVTSKMLLFDRRDTLHTTGDMLGVDGIPRNRGVWERDAGQYDAAPHIFSGCGGATAYRREVWQALGGFDEQFWMYLEDVDFGFRARLAGWEAVFAPDARVYHHLSASGGDVLASYYVGRNTIWLIAKNMPRSLLRRNALAILGGQLAVTLDALRNWRGEAARARLRGQLAGLLGLPQQLQKRHAIQPRRQIEDEELARMLVAK
ncbi:MAG: glycosyltransferase family 2 protein, partial [Caldilinea sp.]